MRNPTAIHRLLAVVCLKRLKTCHPFRTAFLEGGKSFEDACGSDLQLFSGVACVLEASEAEAKQLTCRLS